MEKNIPTSGTLEVVSMGVWTLSTTGCTFGSPVPGKIYSRLCVLYYNLHVHIILGSNKTYWLVFKFPCFPPPPPPPIQHD